MKYSLKRLVEPPVERVATVIGSEEWLSWRCAQKAAEHQTDLAPVAAIEDTNGFFRITAAAPEFRAGELTVHVLPQSIVVEGRNAQESTVRMSIFPLSCPVRRDAVAASFRDGEITIVALRAFGKNRTHGAAA